MFLGEFLSSGYSVNGGVASKILGAQIKRERGPRLSRHAGANATFEMDDED